MLKLVSTEGLKRLCESDMKMSHQIRWIEETANARIKHWKYLAHVLPTKCIQNGQSVGNADADAALEAKTMHLSAHINLLQSYVEEHTLDKRSFNWKAVSTEAMNFPKLDEEHLRNLTYGVYQVKIPSHTRVHRM